MAESTSSALEALRCSICLSSPKRAVRIPCLHFFCRVCLKGLIDSDSARYFRCPNCRFQHEVPEQGVDAFPKAFPPAVSAYPNCSLHSAQKLKLFCLECEITICAQCRHIRHDHHKTEKLTKVVRDMQKSLKQSSKELNLNRVNLESIASTLKKEVCDIAVKRKHEVSNVHKQVKIMKSMIDSLSHELVTCVEKEYEERSKFTAKSQQVVQKKLEDIQRFIDMADIVQSCKGSDDFLIGFQKLMQLKENITGCTTSVNNDLKDVFFKGVINRDELKRMLGHVEESAKRERLFSARPGRTEWNRFPVLPAILSRPLSRTQTLP